MYLSNYSKSAIAVLALLCLMAVCACQDDDMGGEHIDDSPLGEDVALALSYDAIVSTFLLPDNPDDAPKLSPGERALATPVFEGRRVQQFINKDGSIDGEIIRMDFEGMPDYPEGRIGGPALPERYRPERIVINQGVSTLYGADGEVLGNSFQQPETAMYFQQIAEDLSERVPLTEEEFGYVLQGFEQAGFELAGNSQDDNIAELAHEFEDGRRTVLYIDKAQQHIRARAHFDAEGQLETLSDYVFEPSPSPGEPAVLTAHRFVTFYDAPESGVRMGIWKAAQFRNFKLEKTL